MQYMNSFISHNRNNSLVNLDNRELEEQIKFLNQKVKSITNSFDDANVLTELIFEKILREIYPEDHF